MTTSSWTGVDYGEQQKAGQRQGAGGASIDVQTCQPDPAWARCGHGTNRVDWSWHGQWLRLLGLGPARSSLDWAVSRDGNGL